MSEGQRAEASAETPWYLAGVGSYFLANGIQMILFPWLVAIELDQSAGRVGIAQASLMLPGLAFVLFGGAFADRHDCRRLLMGLHALAALPALGLAIAIGEGALRFELLLAYAVAMGSIGAFINPARDSLLNRVAGDRVQRMVIATLGTQNVAQIAGAAIAGAAAWIGAVSVLLVQAAACIAAAVVTARLAPAPPSRARTRTGALAEIRAGLEEVASSSLLLPVTLLAAAIGFLFIGSFMVAIPLLVRDVYGGSSGQIAGLNATMTIGMLSAIVFLGARGGVQRQGRALVLGLVEGATMLGLISTGPPLPLVYACMFLFGAGGGFAMTASRTLVQEAASESHRARILSVFNLGFMGAGPLGSLVMGFLVASVGPLAALLWPCGGMIAAVVLTAIVTDVWRFESAPRPAAAGAPTEAGA